jgi:oligoribonuclease (3'-5' exoribonuclease)
MERIIKYFDTVEEAFHYYKEVKEKYIKEVADKWKNKITDTVYQAMYNYQVEITD